MKDFVCFSMTAWWSSELPKYRQLLWPTFSVFKLISSWKAMIFRAIIGCVRWILERCIFVLLSNSVNIGSMIASVFCRAIYIINYIFFYYSVMIMPFFLPDCIKNFIEGIFIGIIDITMPTLHCYCSSQNK